MNDAYSIRPAKGADAGAVGDLWTAMHEEQEALDERTELSGDALERWTNDFSVWVEDEDSCLIVGQTNKDAESEVVGFIHAEWWSPPPTQATAPEVYIQSLYVKPAHRRRGIASELVDRVRTWTRGHEIGRLRFGVVAANDAARKFWTAQGAEPYVEIMTMDV